MNGRDELVIEARAWCGTPYKSKHYPIRQQGCDCASFLLGVGIGAGIFPKGTRLPVYAADRHLHKSDEAYHHELMKAGFVPVKPMDAQPGDAILYVMGSGQPASHTAVITECKDGVPCRHVHAYRSVGKVCETRINTAWLKRARFAYQFPGVIKASGI